MAANAMVVRNWMFVAFAVLIMNTVCSPSGTVIKVQAPGSPFHVSDTITVPIEIENVADLTAIEIHLSFNPAVLEVTKINFGDFPKADYVVQNTFDNTTGTIDYAVAQINRPPTNGSGMLIEIVFRAKAGGNSPIRFRETQTASFGALLADSKGTAIKVSLVNGDVNVNKP